MLSVYHKSGFCLKFRNGWDAVEEGRIKCGEGWRRKWKDEAPHSMQCRCVLTATRSAILSLFIHERGTLLQRKETSIQPSSSFPLISSNRMEWNGKRKKRRLRRILDALLTARQSCVVTLQYEIWQHQTLVKWGVHPPWGCALRHCWRHTASLTITVGWVLH